MTLGQRIARKIITAGEGCCRIYCDWPGTPTVFCCDESTEELQTTTILVARHTLAALIDAEAAKENKPRPRRKRKLCKS